MPAIKDTRLSREVAPTDLLYCKLGDHWTEAENFVKRGPNRAEPSRARSYRAYCKACHSGRDGKREGPVTKSTHGFIYLIGEVGQDELTVVKVGYSVAPEARLRELQTGNARKLEILGLIKGTPEDERELHNRYAQHRRVGEWFEATGELLDEFGVSHGEKAL